MPFDWVEYLTVARYLNGDVEACGDEGRWRSAVSRAYYAAFCHARNYARDIFGYRPRYIPQDHEDVRREFANAAQRLAGEQRKQIANVALQLENLRRWRNECDYKDQLMGLRSMVVPALKEATILIDNLTRPRP